MCGQVCGDKVWRRAEEEKAEEEPGIQNQKQEPHTKMWGTKELETWKWRKLETSSINIYNIHGDFLSGDSMGLSPLAPEISPDHPARSERLWQTLAASPLHWFGSIACGA